MEEMKNAQVNMCNFMDVKPIMMDLPYPPIQVKEKKSVLCPSVKHRLLWLRIGNVCNHAVH